MNSKSHRTLTGLLLIVTPILFMTAFTLLQINFEYPDILRQPAMTVMEKAKQAQGGAKGADPAHGGRGPKTGKGFEALIEPTAGQGRGGFHRV